MLTKKDEVLERRFSEPEYEELPDDTEIDDEGVEDEDIEDPTDEEAGDGGEGAPAEKDEGPKPDDVVFTTEDGTEITREEAQKGYMRQADYTRKTQEISAKEQAKAEKIVENKEDYPEQDVKTAEYILKIAKDKFGLMTRDEFDRQQQSEKIDAEITGVVEKFTKDGYTITNEKLVKHMQENKIFNPQSAARDLFHDEIVQKAALKANKSAKYKTDTGKKLDPSNTKRYKGEKGYDNYLSDMLDDASARNASTPE